MRLDLRPEQTNPPQTKKQKHALRRGKVLERDPEVIDGIVIHQTACTFGKAKDQPTRYHRALGVACHALAFNDGTAVMANPLRWLVWHGNGFNDHSLGLEIEGSFPGVVGRPRTLANEPETPVTQEVIQAARDALAWLVEAGRAEGMPIQYIWAHRQSSPTRRSDPGEALWKAVVLEYAVPVLGLRMQPNLLLNSKRGAGRGIPKEWDPSQTLAY